MSYYRGKSTSAGGAFYYVEAANVHDAERLLAKGLKNDDGFLDGEAARAELRPVSALIFREAVGEDSGSYALDPGVYVSP